MDSSNLNVWEWTNENSEWISLFAKKFTSDDNQVSIIASGDLSGLTYFTSCFCGAEGAVNQIVYCCDLYLPNCPNNINIFSYTRLKKTPNIKLGNNLNFIQLSQAFSHIADLKKIGKIYGNVSLCNSIFEDCRNVEEGILDMYNTLSSQTPSASYYYNAFKDCGIDTEEGRAALAQIPQSWGGLA